MTLKLKIVKKSFEFLLKKHSQRVFFDILAASEIIEANTIAKNHEQSFINSKKQEFDALEAQEIQESSILIELQRKALELKQVEEEFKDKEKELNNKKLKEYGIAYNKDIEISKKIKELTNENSKLQDKLVTYELSFNLYVQEMESLLIKSKTGSTISPIKARIL